MHRILAKLIGRRKSPTVPTTDEQPKLKVYTIEQLDEELTQFDLQNSAKAAILSAQELYLIHQLGYEVVGVAFGNIVYSMGLRGVFRTITKAFQRGEMEDFSHMNQVSRDIARNRLLNAATKMGGTEVIGITIQTHEWGDFIEHTFAGTVVKKVRESVAVEQSEVPIVVASN